MSNSNQEIVHEGWLTKSPPTKRIWRAKWRRRWFALRQSGELPGQYFLDYYADRNCRKLKGRIDLDLCDQVDAGLYMERGNSGVVGSKLRGSVFSVRTQARTYHLEAASEADMEKWVDAICRVCGLRADDNDRQICTFTSELNTMSLSGATNNADPYICISDCITGQRSQDAERPRAFTFNTQGRSGVGTTPEHNRMLPNEHMRSSDAPSDNTDNDSNQSEDDCNSLVFAGPPVPPRPPKTFRLIKDGTHGEHIYVGGDTVKYTASGNWGSNMGQRGQRARCGPTEGGWSQSPYSNTAYANTSTTAVHYQLEHPSNQYCNLLLMPPAVDRALKPRHSSHSAGHIHSFFHNSQVLVHKRSKHAGRSDTLQYLDLDLHTPTRPSTSKESARRNTVVSHGKSQSACDDSDSAYKTVDFLKTEAFNMTRKDAEALRGNAMAL